MHLGSASPKWKEIPCFEKLKCSSKSRNISKYLYNTAYGVPTSEENPLVTSVRRQDWIPRSPGHKSHFHSGPNSTAPTCIDGVQWTGLTAAPQWQQTLKWDPNKHLQCFSTKLPHTVLEDGWPIQRNLQIWVI